MTTQNILFTNGIYVIFSLSATSVPYAITELPATILQCPSQNPLKKLMTLQHIFEAVRAVCSI